MLDFMLMYYSQIGKLTDTVTRVTDHLADLHTFEKRQMTFLVVFHKVVVKSIGLG